DLIAILRNHALILPADLALLFKTFLTLDGVGRRLDPQFNIVLEATPFLTSIIQERYSPTNLAKRAIENTRDSLIVLNELPKEVQNLVRSAQRGDLQVKMELNRLDRFGHLLDRAVSRLTIGIVVAALIIGTAVVTATQQQPELFGIPAWGFLGFLIAALGGVWLLISIWRGNRD
ncbi:MAG: ubiquinone biosynthesis protein UbiB, partial [Gammaproteobacteria bacterium]|nr:ubiquinone biosynthesis protein UbiB [Gammaproteobacteria bacterium]